MIQNRGHNVQPINFFVILFCTCYNLRVIRKIRGGILADGKFCVVNVAADYHDNSRAVD